MVFTSYRMSCVVKVLLVAAVSMFAVVLIFGGELSRRLGEYDCIYLICWCVFVFGLVLILQGLIKYYDFWKILIVSLVVGYIPTVFAYIFAVVIDVSYVREIHNLKVMDSIVVSLFFPFFVLRGWVFSLFFAFLLFVLNFFGWLRSAEKNVGR